MMIYQIKEEALKLMFATYEDIDTLDETSNEIGSYLRAMNGSIMRALLRLQQKGLTPLKRLEAKNIHERWILNDNPLTIDVKDAIDDMYKLDRVVVNSGYIYEGNADYRFEGDILTVFAPKESVAIIYYKKVPDRHELFEVDEDDAFDLTFWGLDEDLQEYIPYFIKGELFKEDDPTDAREAMMIFNTYIEDRIIENTNVQTRVNVRYRDDW